MLVTPEQLDERRAAATHKRNPDGTLFQVSTSEDDFPDSAWWFSEASGMWQVSSYSNDEIRVGSHFEAIPRPHNVGNDF